MGRRNRERIQRIESGLEKSIAEQAREALSGLGSVGRKAVSVASRKGVVAELSKGSVEDQTDRLSSLVGTGNLRSSKLRDAIMSKAPGEMDKAIKKFQKEGREITVESLCAEAKSSPGFVRMCSSVGIDMRWFEGLAKQRMERFGL